MKTIRGGMGIGDAIYVHAVCRHYLVRGEQLKVATSWPEVFRFLPVQCIPFTRNGIDILAHYSMRKPQPTKQWHDVCITARVSVETDLAIEWRPTSCIGDSLREQADGRPIIAVQLPRAPMGRTDGFGAELLPDCGVIQKLIDRLRGRALLVQIGAGKALHRFDGIDIDLTNRTTVCELFDLGQAIDGFLGYVSFIVPLAEAMRKPALLVWSRRGLNSRTPYIKQITPQKVLYRDTSHYVVDDDAPALDEKAELLLRQANGVRASAGQASCDRREWAGIA
jgi:hypothetical protein